MSKSVELPNPNLRPKHIAIIMDGNGRWAQRQDLPRSEGHREGSVAVQKVTEEAARLGIECLTLYCLSNENWKRPEAELQFLMQLLQYYMVEERDRLQRNNIRLHILGRREGIPDSAWQEMQKTCELTKANTGLQLCLAINYGSRQEIVDSVRAIAGQVQAGELAIEAIDEQTIAQNLYTAGLPDPDLLIRTAGELRISNYLLWQISYAELWVTEKCWPDFSEADLHEALVEYAARNRKFGGLAKDIE